MRQGTTICVAVLAVLTLTPSLAHAQRIYWTGGGGVHRAHLDGSNAELVVPGAGSGIALDLIEGKIYFRGEPGKIQRANLDGSDVQDVVSVYVHSVRSIALDLLHRKIYWADSWRVNESILVGGVFRADLDDGANAEAVLPYEGESHLQGIALDPGAGYLYWTYSSSSFQGILRRSLDGPPTEQLITEGLYRPGGIALDLRGGGLYFTDSGWIVRANLDGSEAGPILEHNGIIWNLALDLRRGKVYWNDFRNFTVYRANLDGSGPEPVMPGLPLGLAIDDRVYFDCDSTGQLDLDDQSSFVDCLFGPGGEVGNACLCADENGDRDVDLEDFAAFQRLFGAE